MNKTKIIFFLISCMFIYSCGYKIVDKRKLQSFDIAQINTTGEKRINFKLKNKLLSNKKEGSADLIILDLNSKKIKTVKDKNIKNEITKYQIDLEILISFKKMNENKINSFLVKETGTYDTSSQHSQTLNNEKKLIDLLVSDISEEIIDQLIIKLNDL